MTTDDIKRLFGDPYSLRRVMETWKDCEEGGMDFIRDIKERRKRMLRRMGI
ncbi:hypothetical protein [Candidatus Methanodesulfokora washburnensis]|uniref:hypothetical protein n=1 Tax=Candidatus Methanodesulfokora washburnensis TaxID=2478471 RepID=UPI001386A529|nr:hypothetical protein [Candidatus Methanodesulfokores washburnensis]